jgi:asparagine synthase (glutamine-hydrolysing)
LFKKALRNLLPSSILHRKKLGFSVPLGLWLRTDLKPMMYDTLSPHILKDIGFFNVTEVQRIVTEHVSGRANHESKLWGLINLVSWWRDGRRCHKN